MSATTELMQKLTEHQASLRDLYNLLKEEQRAIVDLDTPKMDELNKLKEQVQDKQRAAMLDIKKLIESVARQQGHSMDTTLGQVIERLDTKLKPEMQVLQHGVNELAVQVRNIALENKEMLERFLGTVNESLSFLMRVLNTSNQYCAGGTYIQRSQSGAVMVSREA